MVVDVSKRQPITSNALVWLYRLEEKATTEAASGMALESEATLTKTRDEVETEVKRGTFVTPGKLTIKGSAETFLAVEDPLIEDLESAIDEGKRVEFWYVNSAISKGADKFSGEFFTGIITSLTKSAGVNDSIKLSFEYSLNAPGAKGDVTFTEEQVAVANTVFKDSTIQS